MGYVGKWHLYPLSEQYKIVPENMKYGFTDYWRNSTNYQERYNTGYYDEEGLLHKLEGYAPHAQMDGVNYSDFLKDPGQQGPKSVFLNGIAPPYLFENTFY